MGSGYVATSRLALAAPSHRCSITAEVYQKTQSDYEAMAQALAQDDFDESQHPRDDHGRFGEGTSEKAAPAPRKSNAQIVSEAHAIFTDEHAMAMYAGLPASDGGKKIDTDLARELDPNYLADPARVAGVHHEEVSAFADRMFAARMAMPITMADEHVVFLAGGGGSGKSTIRDQFDLDHGAQTLWDGTMATYDHAKEKIDMALKSGRDVVYDVVLCPVAKAVSNAVTRANSSEHGRVVGLDVLVKAHVGAPLTALRLMKDYEGDKRVAFRVFENAGKLKDVHEISDIETRSTVLKYSESPKQITVTARAAFHKISEYGYDDQQGHHQRLKSEIRNTVQASVKRLDSGATESSWRQSFSSVKSWAEGSGRKVGAHDQRCSITQDGEGAGHPFHGNQHTGGTGRAEHAEQVPGMSNASIDIEKFWEKEDAAHEARNEAVREYNKAITGKGWAKKEDWKVAQAEMEKAEQAWKDAKKEMKQAELKWLKPGMEHAKAVCIEEAKRQDFPVDKLKFTTSEKEFNVGGNSFSEAGHFDPVTKEITCRLKGMALSSKTAGLETISHELGHVAFHVAEDTVGRGKLWSIAREKELAEAGGVSDYSKSYWSKAGAGVHCIGSGYNRLAVNETIAEIHSKAAVEHAAAKYEGRPEKTLKELGVPEVWKTQYNDIMGISKWPTGAHDSRLSVTEEVDA